MRVIKKILKAIGILFLVLLGQEKSSYGKTGKGKFRQ